MAALGEATETPERLWTAAMRASTAEEVAHLAEQAHAAQVSPSLLYLFSCLIVHVWFCAGFTEAWQRLRQWHQVCCPRHASSHGRRDLTLCQATMEAGTLFAFNCGWRHITGSVLGTVLSAYMFDRLQTDSTLARRLM